MRDIKTTKFCKICSTEKPVESFYINKTTKDGLSCRCKECHLRLAREYYENVAKFTVRSPQRFRKDWLKKKHGLTINQYDEMYISQGGRCGICGKHQSELKERLNVDHNHVTEEIRGLLCCCCNRGVGMFKEDKQIFLNALKYLRI